MNTRNILANIEHSINSWFAINENNYPVLYGATSYLLQFDRIEDKFPGKSRNQLAELSNDDAFRDQIATLRFVAAHAGKSVPGITKESVDECFVVSNKELAELRQQAAEYATMKKKMAEAEAEDAREKKRKREEEENPSQSIHVRRSRDKLGDENNSSTTH